MNDDSEMDRWVEEEVNKLVENATAEELDKLNNLFKAVAIFEESDQQPEAEEIEEEINRLKSRAKTDKLRDMMDEQYHSVTWKFWQDWFTMKNKSELFMALDLRPNDIMKLIKVREMLRTGDMEKYIKDQMEKRGNEGMDS